MPLGQFLRNFARQHGVDRTVQYFQEARRPRAGRQGQSGPVIEEHQISLRDLAEGLMGPNWATKFRKPFHLLEAAEAVDSSTFSAITGQLFVDIVKEKYNSPDFIGDELVTVYPVANGNLATHLVPSHSQVVDPPKKIQQGQPYDFSTFLPLSTTLPAPEKRGEICAVTFEMIYADLTRQALDSAAGVGRRVGIDREERILKVVLGLVNNYIFNLTSFNTYQTSTWTNTTSGNVLNDWQSLNIVEQMAANMLDPITGKVIDIPITEMKLLVMPYRKYNAKRALTATNTRSGTYPTSTPVGNIVDAPNPIDVQYQILTSKFAYQLLLASGLTAVQAQEYFFLGAFKKAFAYRQVYPLQTIQAPPNNPYEFLQDIVVAVKAQEFGVAGVMDPRFSFQSTNT